MTLLILVKRKDGRVAVTDFTDVQEKCRVSWPETQLVNRPCEALARVKKFLGIL